MSSSVPATNCNTAGMETARRPNALRIARQVALALAVLVLLLSSYVSLYWVDCWDRASVRSSGIGVPQWVFAPLQLYERSDVPGGLDLCTISIWCRFDGECSYRNARDIATHVRSRQMDPTNVRFASGLRTREVQ